MKMGDIPCDESFSKAVDHKSSKNSPLYGQAFVGENHVNCRGKEVVEMDLLMENLDISDEVDLNELLLEEHENLHVKESIRSSFSAKNTLQFSSTNTTELKILSKCSVILCSEALQSCPSIFAEVELSTIELGYECSAAASNSTEDNLVPTNDSSKYVSALKGSRALQGKPLDSNLHVRWEANVYDPPVTSSSHTMKGHHHRLPKAKILDHHKHKHMKARPSNTCSRDRKHSHRRCSSSISDPRLTRMQALARRSLQSGFGLSKIQTLDIAAASGQESAKCAGSFHAESPWSLPLPIAEAL